MKGCLWIPEVWGFGLWANTPPNWVTFWPSWKQQNPHRAPEQEVISSWFELSSSTHMCGNLRKLELWNQSKVTFIEKALRGSINWVWVLPLACSCLVSTSHRVVAVLGRGTSTQTVFTVKLKMGIFQKVFYPKIISPFLSRWVELWPGTTCVFQWHPTKSFCINPQNLSSGRSMERPNHCHPCGNSEQTGAQSDGILTETISVVLLWPHHFWCSPSQWSCEGL